MRGYWTRGIIANVNATLALRHSHRMLNAEKEDGVSVNFPRHMPQIGHHAQQLPVVEPSQFEYTVIKRAHRSIFAESLKISLYRLWWKQRKRAYVLHESILPLSAI